jgi:predicted SAM-dependent methyltransferase
MLAEHAWEHLTYEEGILAAINWYKYLKPVFISGVLS